MLGFVNHVRITLLSSPGKEVLSSVRTNSLEKTPIPRKIEGRREMGVTEDEMVGWHHQLNGHESEQTLGVSEGQGSLVCCSSWGRKESDTT